MKCEQVRINIHKITQEEFNAGLLTNFYNNKSEILTNYKPMEFVTLRYDGQKLHKYFKRNS